MQEQIKQILLSAVKAQSLLHSLESISIENTHTKKTKLLLNNYISVVKNLVTHLDKQQVSFFEKLILDIEDKEQTDDFFACVTAFDQLGYSMINNNEKDGENNNKS